MEQYLRSQVFQSGGAYLEAILKNIHQPMKMNPPVEFLVEEWKRVPNYQKTQYIVYVEEINLQNQDDNYTAGLWEVHYNRETPRGVVSRRTSWIGQMTRDCSIMKETEQESNQWKKESMDALLGDVKNYVPQANGEVYLHMEIYLPGENFDDFFKITPTFFLPDAQQCQRKSQLCQELEYLPGFGVQYLAAKADFES
jgi:hypothetical protein